MAYVFSGLASLAVAMLAFLLQGALKENKQLRKEREKEEAKKDKAIADGVVCLLRRDLIEDHAKYTGREEITSHGLQNWLLMYDAYKALGGNGMVDHMKDEVEELHIVNK